MKVAGAEMTAYMLKELQSTNPSLAISEENAREIKEAMCYVATNYQEELKQAEDGAYKTYKLPDGEVCNLKQECFSTPELMFQPSLNGISEDGIHIQVRNAIMSCDTELR